MSSQAFERLIRLEDDELDHTEGSTDRQPNDSCHVPMMANGIEQGFSFLETKQKQNKPTGGGFYFNINGRRIQLNSEQLKYLSLITLTVQNAALSLTMRAARTQEVQFSTPVAVTIAEFLKLITCLALIWYEELTIRSAYRSIKTNIIENYLDTLKVAVPSFVYYVQNNLLYVGSSHLDAATGQVVYQLKILTTALFSVFLLNKKLGKIQWLALIILFTGVALIETIVVSDTGMKSITNETGTQTTQTNRHREEKPIIGFLAILIACCLSGFAGVYFEKILKNTSHVSLWIRNIQLSVVAIPIGLIQVIAIEREHFTSEGPFHGFTALTWLCISLQVQGGLLVAVVVKYANNILKGFATSMAIVISTIASIFLFDFNLTPMFVLGSSFVIGSVMLYNKQ